MVGNQDSCSKGGQRPFKPPRLVWLQEGVLVGGGAHVMVEHALPPLANPEQDIVLKQVYVELEELYTGLLGAP